MGVGHLKLRKLIKDDTTYLQKTDIKHKHEFVQKFILEERAPNGEKSYFEILKCDKCLSFKSVPTESNSSGYIGELNEEQKKMPKIIGIKKHDHLIGFGDLEKVYLNE